MDWARQVWQTVQHPLASDAGFLTLSQCLAAGLSLLTTALAARLLEPQEYGVAAMVMAYPTLLWSFFQVKSVSIATRYIANFHATGQHEQLKNMCQLSFGLDLLAALAAFLLVGVTSGWIARSFLHLPDAAWLMVVYGASFPLCFCIGTSWAILSALHKFRWLAGLQVLDKAITLVTVVALVMHGFGMAGVVLGIALGQILYGIVMMSVSTYALQRAGIGVWWNVSFRSLAPLRQELTAFFGWNYVMVTLTGFVTQFPLMLLGYFRSPEEAGYYRLATTLMTASSFPELSMGRVAYPTLATRWEAGERQSLGHSLQRWTLHGGLPLGTLILLSLPLLPIVLPVVLGPAYVPMIHGAQLLIVSSAISTMFFWLHSLYYASGRIAVWTKAYGLYTACVLGFSWCCIQQRGFVGLASMVAVGKIVFTVSLALFALTTWEKWQ